MASDNPGCFAWCISFKKACNERWAKFRNNFRRRFYARRGQTLDPATLLNASGTKDMQISKMRYKSNKVVPIDFDPAETVKGVPAAIGNEVADGDFERLVEEYVSNVIRMAADNLNTDRPLLLSNTKVSADDNMSLTSSVISQIADTAVTESLTNIIMDTNQSARRPRTIREFFETFGISGEDTAADGLSHVDV